MAGGPRAGPGYPAKPIPSSGPSPGPSAEGVDTGARPGSSPCRWAFYSQEGWLAANYPVLLPPVVLRVRLPGAWPAAVAGGASACVGDRLAAAGAGSKESLAEQHGRGVRGARAMDRGPGETPTLRRTNRDPEPPTAPPPAPAGYR